MHRLRHFVGRFSLPASVPDVFGFAPDPLQQRLLDTTSRRVIVNCSRQWGKSTITAARALAEAVRLADSLIVVVSPSERQSGEFILKVRELAAVRSTAFRGDGVNRLSVKLLNGSRIVGLPAKEGRIRGFSGASMVIVDEASRVPDELYFAVRPFLAGKNGSLWMLSTPLAERGFFWKTWVDGGPAWERFSAPATECPRISSDFLEEERLVQGEWRFKQEYMCQFAGNKEALFEREMILKSLTREREPLFSG